VIYFYYGKNDFLIRREVSLRAVAFIKTHDCEAVTRIDAGDVDPTALISEIININMFQPERLIIVRGAENVKSAWEKLGENLARVPDETTLVIAAVNPDKRTKTFKDLQKIAETREFQDLKPYEMKKFVLDEANLRHVDIKPNAADRLIELTTNDENQAARIAGEIVKLSALDRIVDVDLIEKMVEPDIAGNAFLILEKALSGRRDDVKAEITILRRSGESANRFFGLLMSQIFALSGAVFCDDNAASELKINPFQLRNAYDMARRIGDRAEQQKRVRKIVGQMAETDAKMKLSNDDNAWVLVESMLMRF